MWEVREPASLMGEYSMPMGDVFTWSHFRISYSIGSCLYFFRANMVRTDDLGPGIQVAIYQYYSSY